MTAVVTTITAPVNYAEIAQTANHTVKNYALASLAVGFIPFPLVDIAALVGVQLKMLHSLANEYNVPFSKDMGKTAITVLLGSVLPMEGVAPISSLLKVVPGIGPIAGGVSLSLLGSAATYAIGKVFIQHFASGGTFLTFDPEAVRKYFAEEFEKGKLVVSELKHETSPTNE